MYTTEAFKVEFVEESGTIPRMGEINYGGHRRTVCLGLLENINAGDYVIVHKGFALCKLDVDSARKTLDEITDLIRQ